MWNHLTTFAALAMLTTCARSQVPASYYVTLSWQDNSPSPGNPNPEDGFVVERNDAQNQDAAAWFVLVTLGANATTHRDTALAASHLYSYRVRSFNTKGYSVNSNVATVSTPGGPPLPQGPPDVPLNLLAAAPVYETADARAEAETLVMVGAWTIQADNTASNGSRVQSAAGSPADALVWRPSLSLLNNYELRVRVKPDASQTGSFSVTVDGGSPLTVNVPQTDLWITRIVNLPNLGAGQHEIRLTCHDADVRTFDVVALVAGASTMTTGARDY